MRSEPSRHCLVDAELTAWFVLHDRKDFEFSQLLSKIEDEQSVASQSQKKIKELQVC